MLIFMTIYDLIIHRKLNCSKRHQVTRFSCKRQLQISGGKKGNSPECRIWLKPHHLWCERQNEKKAERPSEVEDSCNMHSCWFFECVCVCVFTAGWRRRWKRQDRNKKQTDMFWTLRSFHSAYQTREARVLRTNMRKQTNNVSPFSLAPFISALLSVNMSFVACYCGTSHGGVINVCVYGCVTNEYAVAEILWRVSSLYRR